MKKDDDQKAQIRSSNGRMVGNLPKDYLIKHNKCKTQVYSAWMNMKARCKYDRPKHSSYYGKITYCNQWENFLVFLSDMGEPPSKCHSLDRIDNTKGYFKENCRWATKSQQSRNTSRNRKIVYKGNEYIHSELSQILFDNKSIITKRLNYGWDIQKAISHPYKPLNKK